MRDRSVEITVLEDTLKILEQGWYKKGAKRVPLKLSAEKRKETLVFLPEEVKQNACRSDFQPPFVTEGGCCYGCENKDSFTLAMELLAQQRLCTMADTDLLVLNLANPVHPGGGVRRGARAQEEDLCRRSSLLHSLESPEARRYYAYNAAQHTMLSTGALMITPQVEIIKDVHGQLLDETQIVSVLTFAAPCLRFGYEGKTQAEYERMVYERVTDMLKCVAYLGYRHLVLGAWGCGAFRNDARVMSDLFYKALKDLDYNGRKEKDLFRCIEFAVLDGTREQYNFKEFRRNFTDSHFHRDKERQESLQSAEANRSDKTLDRIRGCLIGGAAGDALGYAIEFWGGGQIFSHYGTNGITSYELEAGTGKAYISDDTQMTLFTANGILVSDTHRAMRELTGYPRNAVAEAYQDWLLTQEFSYSTAQQQRQEKRFGVSWLLDVPELYDLRAPGNTCLSALQAQREHPERIDDYLLHRQNSSKGCGGVMRVAPLALAYPRANIEILDLEGAQLAAITHSHSLGYMPAAVLTHILHRIVYPQKTMTLKAIVIEAKETAERLFANDPYLPILSEKIEQAITLSENTDSDLDNIHLLGEGWVAEETLAIALYCALRYQEDFSAGMIASVNHRGDSDSTGAVTGNILGALSGNEAIAPKWKTDLELLEVIIEMADDLHSGCPVNKHHRDPLWERKYLEGRRYP